MTDHTARPYSWEYAAAYAPGLACYDCILELRARVERLEQDGPISSCKTSLRLAKMEQQLAALEQAQQPIPRYNLRFRGVDLVPPIDCPDPMLWIAERVYEMAQQQPEPAPVPAEPTDRMDTTLGELLRLNELWNTGEPGGRQLNLSGLDLSGADLSDTDLRDADLSGAFMRSANLTRANLRSANLHGASTRGAIGLPKPAPPAEPAPSTPAGQGELVRRVLNAMLDVPNNSDVVASSFEARAAILAVADWCDGRGMDGAADWIRREVGR